MLFLQKNIKFSSVGAPTSDPRASGGWEIFSQTSKTHHKFLATRLLSVIGTSCKRVVLFFSSRVLADEDW